MNKKNKNVDEIICLLNAEYPDSKSHLNSTCNYTFLVSVVLSAHTTDKAVNSVTSTLFKIANTPEKMVSLSIEEIEKIIKKVGLYKQKAKYLHALSSKIIEVYNGKIPSNREHLESLPGVGRKTANVVLNKVFNMNTVGVDTHVARVCNRLNISKEKSPLKIEKQILEKVEKRHLLTLHNVLKDHGQKICKAIKPKCEKCVVRSKCQYYKDLFNK